MTSQSSYSSLIPCPHPELCGVQGYHVPLSNGHRECASKGLKAKSRKSGKASEIVIPKSGPVLDHKGRCRNEGVLVRRPDLGISIAHHNVAHMPTGQGAQTFILVRTYHNEPGTYRLFFVNTDTSKNVNGIEDALMEDGVFPKTVKILYFGYDNPGESDVPDSVADVEFRSDHPGEMAEEEMHITWRPGQ